MRDYRDAKAMAQTLRGGLKAQSIVITHSGALELVARMLGFKDWQVLAARIDAGRATAKPADPPAGTAGAAATLSCSFCGKTRHEVGKLIAGPDIFICDACVGLCNDIVLDRDPVNYIGAPEALNAKSTDELIDLRKKITARIAQMLQLRGLIDTVGHEGRPPARPDKPSPQKAFILRKSPHERAAFAAVVEDQLAGIRRVAETADSLLAERGGSAESAEPA